MVRVFLVLPDVSSSKVSALCSASRRLGAPVDVLVSYSTLLWKPVAASRLRGVVSRGCVSPVLLDSGAYHLATRGLDVDVARYASEALRMAGEGVAGLVVAPDVPGDAWATLERSLAFAEAYPGEFMPVLQPPVPDSRDPLLHAAQLAQLEGAGLLDRAPRLPGGRILVGIGGLDGARRRAAYVAELVRILTDEYGNVALHLFGAGARLLRSLAKRGLLESVYSVDTGAWQAEIRFRRRTELGADGVVEANLLAIERYLERVSEAVVAT